MGDAVDSLGSRIQCGRCQSWFLRVYALGEVAAGNRRYLCEGCYRAVAAVEMVASMAPAPAPVDTEAPAPQPTVTVADGMRVTSWPWREVRPGDWLGVSLITDDPEAAPSAVLAAPGRTIAAFTRPVLYVDDPNGDDVA